MSAHQWISLEQYEELKEKKPSTLSAFADIVDPQRQSNIRHIYPILGGSRNGRLEVSTALHQAQNPENKPSLKFDLDTTK